MYSLPTYHNGLVTSEHKPKHWGYWCASHPIINITKQTPLTTIQHIRARYSNIDPVVVVVCDMNAIGAVTPGCRSPRIIPSPAIPPLASTTITETVVP